MNYTCLVEVARCGNPDNISEALNVPVFAVIEFIRPRKEGQTLLD